MNLWLIPIFPLLGFLLNGLLGKRLPKALISVIAVGSVAASFVLVLLTLSKRMRDYKQTLDSGQRILQPDASGNRSYMSDEKRAQESSTVNQNLSDCN